MSPESSVIITDEFVITEFEKVVNLTCEALGGPGNSFQWRRNGTDIFSENSPSLTVNVTKPMDGGEYTCLVSNDAGNGTDMTSIYIEPRFIIEPEDNSTGNGQSVGFMCRAEGFPDPVYRWDRLPSREMSAPVDVGIASGPFLDLSPVVFGAEGYYQCVASLVFPASLLLPDSERMSRIATLIGK